MRAIGILLILLGVAWGAYGYTFDTAITIDGDSMRRGSEVAPLPEALRALPREFRPNSMTVQNLGLMEERRSHLIGAGVTLLSGVLLFGFGQVRTSRDSPERDSHAADLTDSTRTCPACAERVQWDATICRFCRTPLEPLGVDGDLIRAARRKFMDGVCSPAEFKRMALYAGRHSLDVNVTERGTGATPLHVAAARGELPLVEALLAAGANRYVMDSRGRSPLDMATDQGIKEVLSRPPA